MKVGIITFHRALNYGAVLQAYALVKYLRLQNVDCELIDYRCKYIEQFYKPLKANPIRETKAFIKEIIYTPKIIEKRRKFDKFISENICTTKPVYDLAELRELNNIYDVFITGSDQVWNRKWSGLDKTYFLSFAECGKKYSYAASFGVDNISPQDERECKKLLYDFSAISVRENSGSALIAKILNRSAEVSLDPTCLFDKDFWRKKATLPQESGYVLLYTLEKSDKLINLARSLARKHNAKVKFITDAIKKKLEFDYCSFLSPTEFVGLFANAGYVITNSFHGLMFATIFEKKVYLAYQERAGAPNSRLKDFINEFGMEQCVVSTDSCIDVKLDYRSIKQKMNQKQGFTKEYFNNILNNKKKIPKLYEQKENCCGCTACYRICPQEAIEMIPDEEGFLYPTINPEKCIYCCRCLKVCSFKENQKAKGYLGIKPVVV